MKLCKYCDSIMMGVYETNAQNTHKYKGFFTCQNCGAICDGEYIENKKEKRTISEKWFNPITKEFESM